MKPESYILSQRFKYLALGSIVGFFLALNESPLDYYLVIGFLILCCVLMWWVKRR